MVTNEDIKTMAEAFNLLMSSQVNGLKGNELVPAGRIVTDFQALVQRLSTEINNDQGGDDET